MSRIAVALSCGPEVLKELRAPLKIRRDSRISVSGQAHRNVKGKCTPKRERRIWDIK